MAVLHDLSNLHLDTKVITFQTLCWEGDGPGDPCASCPCSAPDLENPEPPCHGLSFWCQSQTSGLLSWARWGRLLRFGYCCGDPCFVSGLLASSRALLRKLPEAEPSRGSQAHEEGKEVRSGLWGNLGLSGFRKGKPPA